jgi:homoserine kinase
MARSTTVSIPATTANLGPGFDCLGLALDLRNRIIFEEIPDGLTVSIVGEGQDTIPGDGSNLVVRAAERYFRLVGRWPTGLAVRMENQIPVSSGLGSSAAAALGGLLAADGLVAGKLSPDKLLSLATEIEGHPDNVVPAFYGGLTLINSDASGLFVERIAVPEMKLVTVLPEFNLSTTEARAALPKIVPMDDAIFNASHLGLLIWALAEGDYEKLTIAMQDRLHQPYRVPLIPGMQDAFAAAREAGASAVALSGAGPGAIALARDRHEAIAKAMIGAFAGAGLASRQWILRVDRMGSQVDP